MCVYSEEVENFVVRLAHGRLSVCVGISSVVRRGWVGICLIARLKGFVHNDVSLNVSSL